MSVESVWWDVLIKSQGFWAVVGATATALCTIFGTILANTQKHQQEIKLRTRDYKIKCLKDLFHFSNCLPDFIAEYHKGQIHGDTYNFPDVYGFCNLCKTQMTSELELFLASENNTFELERSVLRQLHDRMVAEQTEAKELESMGHIPTSREETAFSAELRDDIEATIKSFAPRLRHWCIEQMKTLNS